MPAKKLCRYTAFFPAENMPPIKKTYRPHYVDYVAPPCTVPPGYIICLPDKKMDEFGKWEWYSKIIENFLLLTG